MLVCCRNGQRPLHSIGTKSPSSMYTYVEKLFRYSVLDIQRERTIGLMRQPPSSSGILPDAICSMHVFPLLPQSKRVKRYK